MKRETQAIRHSKGHSPRKLWQWESTHKIQGEWSSEPKDPPQSLRKQQAKPQASRWKKYIKYSRLLRKTKRWHSSFFLPYCRIFPPPQPGSGNWLSSPTSHSPLNLPPAASLLTSPKETVLTSANDLSCFPQLGLKSYLTVFRLGPKGDLPYSALPNLCPFLPPKNPGKTSFHSLQV